MKEGVYMCNSVLTHPTFQFPMYAIVCLALELPSILNVFVFNN